MKIDELRRLAIRLAKHTDEQGDRFCGECNRMTYGADSVHTPDCPIAALEAEEAASKVKVSVAGIDIKSGVADGTRVTYARGDGWSAELKGDWESITFDVKGGASWTGWVRSVPTPEKPAGEYEGEY